MLKPTLNTTHSHYTNEKIYVQHPSLFLQCILQYYTANLAEMECLHLILLFTFVPTSIALRCWSHFCEEGSFCIENCSRNQTSCVASYNIDGHVTTPLYFACSTTSGGLCQLSECIPTQNTGSIYSCCCHGDRCNAVSGITPDTTPPSSTPEPTPTMQNGVCVCVCVCMCVCVRACVHNFLDLYYGLQNRKPCAFVFCGDHIWG